MSWSGPFTFLSLRYALVVLILLAWVAAFRHWRRISTKELGCHALIGILSHAVFIASSLMAMEVGATAGLVAFITAMQPILTAGFTHAANQERANLRQWIGLLLGISAVLLVIGDRIFIGYSFLVYALPLLSVMAITIATLLDRRLALRAEISGHSFIPLSLAMLIHCTGALIVFTVISFTRESFHVQLNMEFTLALLYSVLVVSIGSFGLMFLLLRKMPAVKVASLGYLTPPVTLLIAWLVLRESASYIDIAGLFLAGIAVYLVNFESSEVKKNFFQLAQWRQNPQFRTIGNILLLFAAGTVLGLGMPLSRIASELQSHPFGIALWVNFIAAILGITYGALRGRLPKLDLPYIKFLLVWGILTASAFVLIFWVATYISASALSIVMVAEGFAVFVIAALLGFEKPTPVRLLGLSLGFMGIVTLIVSQQGLAGTGSWIWLALALLVPLNFALEDLLMATRMPENADLITVVGLTALVATFLLMPLVLLFNDFFAISLSPGIIELTLVMLALKALIGMSLLAHLLNTAGAVFGSQVAYVKAFAGIVWSMVLLNESLSWVAWLSFAIILIGLLLVEKGETEKNYGSGNLVVA